MRKTIFSLLLIFIGLSFFMSQTVWSNPWNGKVVLQGFFWDCWNENYPQDWYTYLAKLAPRLREMGFDGIWTPPSSKGMGGVNSMGYDLFDHYDLGDKDQKGTVATRFGDKDSFLRLIAVAHANGLEIYPDIVLNHVIGGEEDTNAPGDKYKKFRYVGFSGLQNGRWAKDHWNFHPNPGHWCSAGDICEQQFGPDICYLDAEHGGGGNGQYMRDKAREWFVWFKKQTDADGFRFDAVKHFEAYVVEDLLYNAMGNRIDYFAVGEFVGSQDQLDGWAGQTQNRSGTFDFALRDALVNLTEAGGFFDMGSLSNYQQKNRIKTVPFLNNHDTWRGTFWDSEPGSNKHDDREGDWRKNNSELAPTLDPDNDRADVAYAAAFAVDGSPMVYYEDLFVNSGPERFKADPKALPARKYLLNLIWNHQKLNFKDGAYKVRYQGSPDLLVIERSGKALIGLNDHGLERLEAWAQTDFGPNVQLHDYSGSNAEDLRTDHNGWVKVSVPPMGYAIWGPVGIEGGFSPQPRRTTQEFQLDDDLGDSRASSLGYGDKISPGEFRTGGSIWVAADSVVKVWLYTEGQRDVELRVDKPDTRGAKSKDQGQHLKQGSASNDPPLYLEFKADREGYHQLSARIVESQQPPTRAYIKVEYEAPATSEKF
jgi:alpha-amylase